VRRAFAAFVAATVMGTSLGGLSAVATQPTASSPSPTLFAVVPLAAADDVLEDAGDVSTVAAPIVALLALAEAVRRSARQEKDQRIAALLAWSANTGIGLQSARLLFSVKQPVNATVTELRELSEEARTLAVNLENQIAALVLSLPGSAPPSEDLPHKLSQLVTQLRLLTTEASRTSGDCGEAENPIPYADALVERAHKRAIESCSEGREIVEKRLGLVRDAAEEALNELREWARKAKRIDKETREQLEALVASTPALSAEESRRAA
jgi:hypothetical protein